MKSTKSTKSTHLSNFNSNLCVRLSLFIVAIVTLNFSNILQIDAQTVKPPRVSGESFRYVFLRNKSDPNASYIKDSLESNLLGDLNIREFSDNVHWSNDGLGLVFSGNQTGSPVYSTGTFGAVYDDVFSRQPVGDGEFGVTFEFWILMPNHSYAFGAPQNAFGNAALFEAAPVRNGSTTFCPNQTALFSWVGGRLVTKVAQNETFLNHTYYARCGVPRYFIWADRGVIQQFVITYHTQSCCGVKDYCCGNNETDRLDPYHDNWSDTYGKGGSFDWEYTYLNGVYDTPELFVDFTIIAAEDRPSLAGRPARAIPAGVTITEDPGEWNQSHLLIAPQGDMVSGILDYFGELGYGADTMVPVETLEVTVLMAAFYPFPLQDWQAQQNFAAWIPNSPPVIKSNLTVVALEDIRLNISWTNMFSDLDIPDVLYVHFINLPQNGTLFILLPGGTPNTSFSAYPLLPVALVADLVETNDTIDGNATTLLQNRNGFDWIDTSYATVLQYQTLPNYPLSPQSEIIWYNLTDGTDFRIGYLNITSLPQPDPPVATSETLSVGVARGTQQKFKVNYTDADYANGVIPASTLGYSVTILTLPRYGVLRQWDNNLVTLNSALTDPLLPPHTIQYYANIINSPPLTTEGSSVVVMDSFTFSVRDSHTGNVSNIGTITINVLNHLNLASNTVLTCHQDDNPCFLRLPFGIPSSLFDFMLSASYTVTITSLPLHTEATLARIDVDTSSGVVTLTDVISVPTDIALVVPNGNPNATTDYLTVAFTPKLHWVGNSSFFYHVSQTYNGSNFRSIDTTVTVQVLQINHPPNITLVKPILKPAQNITVYAPAVGLPLVNASIPATFTISDIDGNITNYTVVLTSNVDGNEGAIKFLIDPVNVPNLIFISPVAAKNTSVFAVTMVGSYFQIQAALVNVSISGGFLGTGIMKAIVLDESNSFHGITPDPGFYQTTITVPFTVVPYTVTITAAITTTVFYTLIAFGVACCCGCSWCCSHQHSAWLKFKEFERRKMYDPLSSSD